MRGRRAVRWTLGAAALAVACYFFPLFRIVRVSETPADKIDSAAEYLEQLWEQDLPAMHEQAMPIDELLVALEADPQEAARQFGRQVGLSDTQYYFARGKGTITEQSSSKATVRIDGGEREICLELGVLTGSAVRDATGLVDVNRFSRLQDFNALSGDLNAKVEAEVIAPLRDQLTVGTQVEFVGCAQVKTKRDLDPLCLTPIALEIIGKEGP